MIPPAVAMPAPIAIVAIFVLLPLNPESPPFEPALDVADSNCDGCSQPPEVQRRIVQKITHHRGSCREQNSWNVHGVILPCLRLVRAIEPREVRLHGHARLDTLLGHHRVIYASKHSSSYSAEQIENCHLELRARPRNISPRYNAGIYYC